MDIRTELFRLKDEEYRKFYAKLMPTVKYERIIGVRIPVLRKLAKKFAKTDEAQMFLNQLPHDFYEENNIHALLLAEITDFDSALRETERFLPYIDNWATCDMPPLPAFKNNPFRVLPHVEKWLKSNHTYTVRYAIKVLMDFFMEERFDPRYPEWVCAVKSDEYYVNMMIAWYFATALAKHYDDVLPYITDGRLSLWVHNKTIQKAVESYRINLETKKFLKELRRR